MTHNSKLVGNHWSKNEPVRDSANFYLSPIIRSYIIQNAYSDQFVAKYKDNCYYAEDIFINQYLKDKQVDTILSLCCGFGSVERRFVSQLNNVMQCLGIDLANGAIEVANKRAVADETMKCITYECADLNNYNWEKDKYDLVIANGALHHLIKIENVINGIRHTLKPKGILYACEYVGPSYQDFDVRQLQLINSSAFLVPPELRIRRAVPFFKNKRLFRLLSKLNYITARREKPEWPPWKKIIAQTLSRMVKRNPKKLDFGVVHLSPKDQFLKTDPSECVRSAEIIPLVKKAFLDVEIRPMGGGILQHALDENFYAYFDKENPLHKKSLEMLCQLERHFMDTGEIGIENAFIIAKK